jgi:hypothetical protein
MSSRLDQDSFDDLPKSPRAPTDSVTARIKKGVLGHIGKLALSAALIGGTAACESKAAPARPAPTPMQQARSVLADLVAAKASDPFSIETARYYVAHLEWREKQEKKEQEVSKLRIQMQDASQAHDTYKQSDEYKKNTAASRPEERRLALLTQRAVELQTQSSNELSDMRSFEEPLKPIRAPLLRLPNSSEGAVVDLYSGDLVAKPNQQKIVDVVSEADYEYTLSGAPTGVVVDSAGTEISLEANSGLKVGTHHAKLCKILPNHFARNGQQRHWKETPITINIHKDTDPQKATFLENGSDSGHNALVLFTTSDIVAGSQDRIIGYLQLQANMKMDVTGLPKYLKFDPKTGAIIVPKGEVFVYSLSNPPVSATVEVDEIQGVSTTKSFPITIALKPPTAALEIGVTGSRDVTLPYENVRPTTAGTRSIATIDRQPGQTYAFTVTNSSTGLDVSNKFEFLNERELRLKDGEALDPAVYSATFTSELSVVHAPDRRIKTITPATVTLTIDPPLQPVPDVQINDANPRVFPNAPVGAGIVAINFTQVPGVTYSVKITKGPQNRQNILSAGGVVNAGQSLQKGDHEVEITPSINGRSGKVQKFTIKVTK